MSNFVLKPYRVSFHFSLFPWFSLFPQFPQFRLVAVSALLTALCACRDETSEKPGVQAGDAGGEEALQVSQQAAPAAQSVEQQAKPNSVGPVPFLINEGTYYLGETSVSQMRYPSLESFASSAEGLAKLAAAGAQVRIGSDLIEIKTANDLILAFSEIGTSKRIRFETFGHDLALIADKIVNTDIVTRAHGASAGSVKVFVQSAFAGRLDLGGADGEKGDDGLCPPNYETCLGEVKPQFSSQNLLAQLNWREPVEEHRLDEPEYQGFIPRFSFPQFSVPLTSFPALLNSCKPVSARLDTLVSSHQGTIKVHRRIPEVNWVGGLTGQDGYLDRGKSGKPGQDGGNLKIVKLRSTAAEFDLQNDGGRAGSAGRDAIVLPAQAPKGERVVALETARYFADAARISHVYQSFLSYGEMRESCLTRVGCTRSCVSTGMSVSGELVTKAQVEQLEDSWLRTFDPPPSFPGKMPESPVSDALAEPGANGSKELVEVEGLNSINFQSELGFAIPLPLSVVEK